MGYRGFYEREHLPYFTLNPKSMLGVYERGGSILGSSRGGFDLDKILQACTDHKINQLYIIGGDGTHRGADKIHKEAMKRGLKMTVAGMHLTHV